MSDTKQDAPQIDRMQQAAEASANPSIQNQQKKPEPSQQDTQSAEQQRMAAAADAWDVTEYSMTDSPNYNSDSVVTDPLKIDNLLDESRTVIWASRDDTKIKFVVKKLSSVEMIAFLETVFGISFFLEQKDGMSRDEQLDELEEKLTEEGAGTLYEKILLATEAAIEEPKGITVDMLMRWPEQLVNVLTNAATGGAFGDTAQVRFLKQLNDSAWNIRRPDTGQDGDEVRDTTNGDTEEV